MGRRPTELAQTELKPTTVLLPMPMLPYLRAINSKSRGAAIRACVIDHAQVATILASDMTDAAKVAALVERMPHVQRRIAARNHQPTTEEPI